MGRREKALKAAERLSRKHLDEKKEAGERGFAKGLLMGWEAAAECKSIAEVRKKSADLATNKIITGMAEGDE
jgi:hypothetical protein